MPTASAPIRTIAATGTDRVVPQGICLVDDTLPGLRDLLFSAFPHIQPGLQSLHGLTEFMAGLLDVGLDTVDAASGPGSGRACSGPVMAHILQLLYIGLHGFDGLRRGRRHFLRLTAANERGNARRGNTSPTTSAVAHTAITNENAASAAAMNVARGKERQQTRDTEEAAPIPACLADS
jgi:hypothetical protein